MRVIVAALLAACMGIAPQVAAKGSPHSSTTSSHSSTHSHSGAHSSGSHSSGSYSRTSSYISGAHSISWSNSGSPAGAGTHSKAGPGVQRDSHGKIVRSEKGKDNIKKQHPCPSTGKTSGSCPGYVIDHITPLKRGGADSPTNMQWQFEAAAKQKDRWE
jgi:hypothetical protein